MSTCHRIDRRSPSKGFTLIELVVCLALVGVLALVAWPAAEVAGQRTRELELRRSLREIRQALDAWKAASEDGRIQTAADASGWPPSLQALVDGVPNARDGGRTRLIFLRTLPRDPFAAKDVPAHQSWSLRASNARDAVGARSPASESDLSGRDVFDVRSRSDRLALDGTRLSEW